MSPLGVTIVNPFLGSPPQLHVSHTMECQGGEDCVRMSLYNKRLADDNSMPPHLFLFVFGRTFLITF